MEANRTNPTSSGNTRPFALLTGASQGIGAEYARLLASQGHDLLLVARNEANLTHLSRELETKHNIQAHILSLDLSQPDAANQLLTESQKYRQTPNILINNAGFGLHGEFISHPLPRIQQMLHLNIQAVVESIRLFLPGMVERGSGTIINIASIAGMCPIPYYAEYAATKAFLLSFSQALSEEVHETGVLIQACCPGQTQTSFYDSAGSPPSKLLPVQTATQVARTSLAALTKKHPVTTVTIGWPGKLVILLTKWFPRMTLIKAIGKITKPKNQ